MQSKFYKADFDRVFEAAKRALKKLDMKIEESDYNRATIIATTGTTWLSWGEDVQIQFFKENNGIKVTVESKSSAQLISWGKNSDNEKNILNEIKNTLIS